MHTTENNESNGEWIGKCSYQNLIAILDCNIMWKICFEMCKIVLKSISEKGWDSISMYILYGVPKEAGESHCLGEHCKKGSICHVISSMSSNSIGKKYLQGKMQRILRKGLNVLQHEKLHLSLTIISLRNRTEKQYLEIKRDTDEHNATSLFSNGFKYRVS